jgi:hypothetical protein
LLLQTAAAADRERRIAAAFDNANAEVQVHPEAQTASFSSSIRDEVPSRNQFGARSPREVQVLLSNIESREAALHAKVQQLAEEKAAQQRRLEEEVRNLQRSNAQMEAELRRRPPAESEAFSRADTNQDGVISRPELANALRQGVIEVPPEASYGRVRSPIPMEERTEQSSLLQDTREELQQQLAEIRAEVARCAGALCAEEPLPTSEVADIRQQLAALSSEVMQTSQALLSTPGAVGTGVARDGELTDVRHQLDGLQAQVSRTMYAALSRPGVPAQQDAGRPGELSELRAEVGNLRAELARVGRQSYGTEPQLQEVGAQIEALRMELGSFIGGVCTPPVPSQAVPRTEVQAPSQVFPRADAQTPSEVRQQWRQQFVRDPPAAVGPNAEAAGLQERLSWLRAEVAKVIQDPRYAEDSAPIELRNRLGALLRELHELRHGAEMVAAAAAASGGSPVPRRLISSVSGLVPPAGTAVLRETELRFPKGQPLPPQSRARSNTPVKHKSLSSGYFRPELEASRQSHFANMAAGEWAPGASLYSSSMQPVLGMPTAPVLVCPHVAADLAAEQTVDSARYATNRYVDRDLAGDCIARGGGLPGGSSSSTRSLGVASGSGAPSLSRPGLFHHSTDIGGPRSWAGTPGNATPPLPSELRTAGVLGANGFAKMEATPTWNTHMAPSWQSSVGPGIQPGTAIAAAVANAAAESLSIPADEPADLAPQDNMWRPMRSKISRP